MTDLRNLTYCDNCEGHHSKDIACPVCNGRKPGKLPQKRTKPRKKAPVRKPVVVASTLIPKKVKTGRRTKYTVGRHTFDSKTEAWRYVYLHAMLTDGIITNLELQPEYILRPAYELTGTWYRHQKNGKPRTVSAEKYHPDFRYTIPALKLTVIEEVKGLTKNKPYSKQASNYKQYSLQATIANRDDMVFWVCAGKSDGSVWRYFQQSHGYPELDDLFAGVIAEDKIA